MADETKYRSRQDTDYAPSRPGAEGGHTRRGPEDPLAELARLIGQEDPFADFAGGARPKARVVLPSSDTRTRHEPRYDDRERPYRRAETTGRNSLDRPSSGNGRNAYSYGTTRSEREPDDGFATEREGRDPLLGRRRDQDSTRTPRVDDPEAGFESSRSGAYDPKYSDDAYLPEHGEGIVEEVQPKRRGRTLVIVAAVLGIAIVGAAGAFGYRAIFGPTTSKQPPVIGPQTGPIKVPPSPTSQPEGTKQIYDRIGADPKQNERVVPRIETPIDIAARTGQVTNPAPTPATPSVTPAPAAPITPGTTANEPRRVRTVTVRADGSIVSEPTAPARIPAPAVTQPRPTTQPAPAPTPARPLAVNPYAPTTTEEPAETATPTPVPRVTAPAAPRPTPQPASPWPPLQPSTATQPTAPVSTEVRVQNQTPMIQTVPAASGYVVQVSSQRTEAEAQNAWRSLQARYSAVLGGQQATIRRADLGDRGTFYRAQIGPFTSREPADQLCQRLKAAGGECVVQRN